MPPIEPHIASLLGRRASRNLNALRAEADKTFGERMADRLASGAGSWTFIIIFMGLLAVWMAVNAVAWIHHWDPYPFILLNLILSCISAVQAPVILMSQAREEARDRIRAEADFQVNLKAEVLLEHLTDEVETLKAMLAGMQGGGVRGYQVHSGADLIAAEDDLAAALADEAAAAGAVQGGAR